MILQPVSDNVIVEVLNEDNELTKSGIYLPKTAQLRSNKAKVVAVGTGRTLNNGEKMKPVVNVGDTIIFNEFAGTKINAENKEYLVIKENDIILKIS